MHVRIIGNGRRHLLACLGISDDGPDSDQVLAYVNKNFKMVPIYEYPADDAYADIVEGMKSEV